MTLLNPRTISSIGTKSARIVADTNAAFDPHTLWPIHPMDQSPERAPRALKVLYCGLRGLAWGGAGAMLMALFIHERTGDPRWIDLYRRHFNALREKWEYAGEVGCHLWTHDL